jgi:hypothetical protein
VPPLWREGAEVSKNERELMREALRRVGVWADEVERLTDAELLTRYLILTRHVIEDFKLVVAEKEKK